MGLIRFFFKIRYKFQFVQHQFLILLRKHKKEMIDLALKMVTTIDMLTKYDQVVLFLILELCLSRENFLIKDMIMLVMNFS